MFHFDCTFPFQVEVNHASEIDEIFDAISYRKGASVIRMLQSYLGAETFQVFQQLSYLFMMIFLESFYNFKIFYASSFDDYKIIKRK